MVIEKEFSAISLPITEPEYRAMPELSYSTLATYERTGFNGLEHLFDKKETPSLTLGSVVDTIITGGEEEFNNLFYIADFPSMGEKELRIASYLFDNFCMNYEGVEHIPATYILEAANVYEFQKNWRDDTRVKVLTERCSQYYRIKRCAGNKTIIDLQTHETARAMVRALKESPATCPYFAENDEMSPIRRYYQLKFNAVLDDVGYRCMPDLICINYEKKVIYPIDLKTSSHTEWDFQESFMQWFYMIQARLYWRIIRDNMDKDEYFKDFTLEDYRFIVVNKATLTPLVWEFPYTQRRGTLVDDKGNEYRDPEVIGKELRGYLDCKPPVPVGINQEGVNMITCIHPKEEALTV